MTDLVTLPTTATNTAPTANATHEACCTDETKHTDQISMCGTPIPPHTDLDADAPNCTVCLDLLDQWARNADTHGEALTGIPCHLCPRRFQDAP